MAAMNQSQAEAILRQGIEAAKRNKRAEARNLFLSVLKVDN
jgi:hypothetical protein